MFPSSLLDSVQEAIPMAIGLMLSPFPVLALLILLMTANASRNSWTFMWGWFTGIAFVGTLVYLIPGLVSFDTHTSPKAGWTRLGFGLLLLAGAINQFRKKRRKGRKIPRILERLDRVNPLHALLAGFLLSAVNVKNFMFIAAATNSIAQSPGSTVTHSMAFSIFTLIGSLILLLLLLVYFAFGRKGQELLMRFREWLSVNVLDVLAVLLLVISAILLIQAADMLL